MAPIFGLPNELILSSIISRFPCRDEQIRSLATLLSIRGAPNRNIVLYGLEATGKSIITKALLESLSTNRLYDGTPINGDEEPEDILRYAVVKSAECITGRHLLEQTVGAVAKALEWKGKVGRCDSLPQLLVELEKFLGRWASDANGNGKQRLVLVFDGIDRQRDAPPTLLPALARLGEVIPIITTIFIVTSPSPNFLHVSGVPYIHFQPYTKPELLQILSNVDPKPPLPTGPKETKEVWTRFNSVVWDSLSKHSGRDIVSLTSTCHKLWPKFIRPVLDGTHYGSQFSKLLLATRSLFQNENVLIPGIVSESSVHTSTAEKKTDKGVTTQLPYYSRLLLVAAYLASFNPPRTDQLFFMKAAAAKRRKKGGGTALTKGRPGVTKHRKISRKLLGAQAFLLERMLAIFHAILEDADGRGKYKKTREGRDVAGAADIQMAIATLVSLRLLVKMGAANSADTLEGGSKYRVAVGWEVIMGVARSVGVEAEDYLAD